MEHTSSSSVGIVEGEYVGLNVEDTVGVDRTKLFFPEVGCDVTDWSNILGTVQ